MTVHHLPIESSAESAPAPRSRRHRAPVSSSLALALFVMVLLYVRGNGYHQDLLMLGATYSLLALGLYIPFVMTGALSMAYSAYLSIGGYAVARVATETGMPVVLGILVGAAVSAVVAVVVGLATRRLSSFYLAAVTLLFGRAFESWVLSAKSVTNGATGIGGIRGLSVFGHTLTRDQQLVTAVALIWLIGVGINRMRVGTFGVALRTRHEVPIALEAAGIKVSTITLISLALGAAIASLGGSLFTAYNGAISPETFTLPVVFLAVFMPLLGGRKSAWGAVLGAALVVYSSFNFDWFEGTGTLMFAVAVLVVLLIAPNGILGAFETGVRGGVNRLGGGQGRSITEAP